MNLPHKPEQCVTERLHPTKEQLDFQIKSHKEIDVRIIAAQQYKAIEVYNQWWEGLYVKK